MENKKLNSWRLKKNVIYNNTSYTALKIQNAEKQKELLYNILKR